MFKTCSGHLFSSLQLQTFCNRYTVKSSNIPMHCIGSIIGITPAICQTFGITSLKPTPLQKILQKGHLIVHQLHYICNSTCVSINCSQTISEVWITSIDKLLHRAPNFIALHFVNDCAERRFVCYSLQLWLITG